MPAPITTLIGAEKTCKAGQSGIHFAESDWNMDALCYVHWVPVNVTMADFVIALIKIWYIHK